jgi:isoquinoline 1-oxidoreductase beta subunit
VTLLGGGFGRKSKPDFIVEAARLSKEVGAPVRVQWTREDEVRHAYYHTTCSQMLAAGLDADGKLVAWRHRVASPTISATFAPGQTRLGAGELMQGILDLPLSVPNVRFEVGEAPARARIGWYRSVSNINHAFAVQSFIAELAEATKRDPKEMLLEVLGPDRELTAKEAGLKGLDAIPNYGAKPDGKHPILVGRLRNVIERVCDAAKWDARRGRSLGLAAHRSFLSYVAVVAAVEKGPRGPRVDEVWITADVGKVINLDRVRSQLEGAVVFGMTIALHGRITARDGAIEQTNFRDAPITRINEVPRKIHVELIESDKPPGGVGEPGVPPIAPAIVNAIAQLTGERTRSLPVFPAKVRR